jgi:hypothetical protein
MRRLQRQGQRRRVAVVFHNFDGCFGSPREDEIVYRIWSEVTSTSCICTEGSGSGLNRSA